MKKTLCFAAAAVAALSLSTLAIAQPKPIKKPPPAPPGISLKTYSISAKCGQESFLNLTFEYSNLKVGAPVVVSIPGGDKTVELPAGSGSKTVQFTWKKLQCGGSSTNFREVLNSPVYFDQKLFLPTSVTGGSTPIPTPS